MPAESPQVTISADSLQRILESNRHMYEQITELQRQGTLREEQLRAYRRLLLSPEQFDQLKKDMEETTARVLQSYGMEPKHEILLPSVVNGAG